MTTQRHNPRYTGKPLTIPVLFGDNEQAAVELLIERDQNYIRNVIALTNARREGKVDPVITANVLTYQHERAVARVTGRK